MGQKHYFNSKTFMIYNIQYNIIMFNQRQSHIMLQKSNVNGRANIFDADNVQEEHLNNIIIKNRRQFVQYVGRVRRKMQNKIKNIEMKNNGQDYNFFQEFQGKNSNFVKVGSRKHRNHYKFYQASNKNQQYHLHDIEKPQSELYNSFSNLTLQKNNKGLKLLREPQKIQKTQVSLVNGLIKYDLQNKNKKQAENNISIRQKYRQNSLPSVNFRKKNQSTLKSSRYHEKIKTQQNPESNHLNNRVEVYEMENFFIKIPKNRQVRTTQQFIPLLRHLKSFNKIFMILAQQLALCLLRIGIYHQLLPADILYKNESDKNSFYIVLCGVVGLINGTINMKKFIYTGQTLGQQMLFGNIEEKKFLEMAKSITKTYLLEIKVKDYKQIRYQAKRYGFSNQFQKFQDQLRDGLTIKNISRNGCLINRQSQFQS